MKEQIGEILEGRYLLIEVIGRGGMGVVYRAQQLEPIQREVAIKMLLPERMGQAKIETRFEREAEIISKLRHPSALRLFDVGRLDDGRLYLVTELLEGETLAERLRRGPISEHEVCRLLLDVIPVLIEAHDAGVIHRDLKPSNLFIARIGAEEITKILDFGVARRVDSSLTTTFGLCGTPGYLAPESLTGATVDVRADLYALGAVAFVALIGRPPFSAASAMELLMAHAEAPVPPLPRVHRDLEALVHRLMEKDRELRPRDGREVLEMLAPIERALNATVRDTINQEAITLADAPFSLSPKTQPTKKQRPPRLQIAPRVEPPSDSKRNRWIALGLGLAALVGVVALAVGDRRAAAVDPTPEPPQETPIAVAPPPARILAPRLVVNTDPMGAEVRMGDQMLGSTPLSVQVAADRIEPVLLTLDGHERWSGRPRRTAEDRFEVSVQLQPGVDLEGWLDRPGVRLLAIEFYAGWCAPCRAEAPRWRALAKRYRSEGLRVVTVVTKDDKEACANLEWSPDAVLCDPQGSIAERLRVGAKLPVAHLWDWQGRMVVNGGRLQDVEREVAKWSRRSPRVAIEVKPLPTTAGISEAGLLAHIRSSLLAGDKVVVVANEAERRKLAQLKLTSYRHAFDEELTCNLGKELSANSLLEAEIETSSSGASLRLGLFGLERACLQATATDRWRPEAPHLAARSAVDQLMAHLRPAIEAPGG